MIMASNESGDLQLIAAVSAHPQLYDNRHRLYKDDRYKKQTWMTIAEKLDTDVATVRRRWEGLRDRFVRVYREKESKSTKTDEYKKRYSFPYMDEIKWLIPHIRRRKTTSIYSSKKNKDEDNEAKSDQLTDTLNENVMDFCKEEIKLQNESTCSSPIGQSSSNDYEPSTPIISLTTSLASVNEPKKSEENDADLNFMKSVVSDMRMLSPMNRIRFKREIMTILEKYAEIDNC